MIPTKILAAVMGVLLTVGGVGAVAGGAPLAATDGNAANVTDAEVDATLDNGTVTVTVMDAGEPLSNASVEVNGEEVTTDANGTAMVSIDPNETDEVEIEVEHAGLEAEVEYDVTSEGLSLVSEEYEYGEAGEDDRGESEVADEHQSEEGDENQSDVADADESEEETDDDEEETEEDDEADEAEETAEEQADDDSEV